VYPETHSLTGFPGSVLITMPTSTRRGGRVRYHSRILFFVFESEQNREKERRSKELSKSNNVDSYGSSTSSSRVWRRWAAEKSLLRFLSFTTKQCFCFSPGKHVPLFLWSTFDSHVLIVVKYSIFLVFLNSTYDWGHCFWFDSIFWGSHVWSIHDHDLFTIMIMIYTRALLQTRMFVYMRVLYWDYLIHLQVKGASFWRLIVTQIVLESLDL
jgi:hypothetical protein